MIKDIDSQIGSFCRFCNPPEKDRILYESDNFYVMLSLGPIVEGYLLLVSKEHISCCGEIPDSLFPEFCSIYKMVEDILLRAYGACVSYEHGRSGSCLSPSEGSKHCYHAHMHFVPLFGDVNDEVAKELRGISIDGLGTFQAKYRETGSGYLFVKDSRIVMYPIYGSLKSQYLRRRAAQLAGKEELWDWITYQGWYTIEEAKKKLSKYFPDSSQHAGT